MHYLGAAQVGERTAANQKESCALEQELITAEPERELNLQALRIGDTAITALPSEIYALTRLTLKARSPLRATLNVERANGTEGYIPPPEQHFLGGYTTWAPRRQMVESHGASARAVLASRTPT